MSCHVRAPSLPGCAHGGVAFIVIPHGTLSRYTFVHRRRILKLADFGMIARKNLRSASGIHFTTAGERDEATWHDIDFTGRAYVIPPPLTATPEPASDGGDKAPRPTVLFLSRVNPVMWRS